MRAPSNVRIIAAVASVSALLIALSACGADDDGDAGTSDSGPRGSTSATGDSGPDHDASKRNNLETSANGDGGDAHDEASGHGADNNGPNERGGPDRPRGTLFTVTEVVDGDTVHLDKPGETSVRIIGIETPETVHPSEPVECGGPAASKEAERLLAGRRVRLTYDPSQGRTDAYGRILGYIDVPGSGDYGLSMIESGFAAEYTYDAAYHRQRAYRAAQRRAQTASHGIWRRCGGVDTPLEQPTTEPEPTSEAPPTADSGAGCAAGYSPCVPSYPPDLDCDDVDGPITITGNDPHGFDADDDGVGCD